MLDSPSVLRGEMITSVLGQSIQFIVPNSEPCEDFPNQICFELSFPDREIVRRGFCQLSLCAFR